MGLMMIRTLTVSFFYRTQLLGLVHLPRGIWEFLYLFLHIVEGIAGEGCLRHTPTRIRLRPPCGTRAIPASGSLPRVHRRRRH